MSQTLMMLAVTAVLFLPSDGSSNHAGLGLPQQRLPEVFRSKAAWTYAMAEKPVLQQQSASRNIRHVSPENAMYTWTLDCVAAVCSLTLLRNSTFKDLSWFEDCMLLRRCCYTQLSNKH